MPARTGQQYIDGLRAQEREVWLGGERVNDVTTHQGLAGGVRAIAWLYDLQHEAELRSVMTYASPTSGDPVGRSFDNPKTREALEARSRMMLNWARATCGMMGRSPDFMNVTFAAWGAAADYFGEKRPEFGDNMRRYVEYIRENDVTPDPCADQSAAQPQCLGHVQPRGRHRARGQERNRAGIVVHGARILATLGPLSDEIAVYSPRLARHSERPLAVRDELLDRLRHPGAQVPLPRQLRPRPLAFRRAACRRASRRWTASSFLTTCWCRGSGCSCSTMSTGSTRCRTSPIRPRIRRIRARRRTSPNASSCWASRCLMTQTLGNAHLPHTEERIGELMLYTELMRSCMRAAEADAAIDRWGVMCPAILPVDEVNILTQSGQRSR